MPISCNVPLKVPHASVLIMDMLITRGTPLGAHAICRAGALMGISETAMRVSLTRLVADGKIVRTERGLYIAAREAHALFRRVDQ